MSGVAMAGGFSEAKTKRFPLENGGKDGIHWLRTLFNLHLTLYFPSHVLFQPSPDTEAAGSRLSVTEHIAWHSRFRFIATRFFQVGPA